MRPTRCCVACRKRNDKNNLIRIVADKGGNAIYDKEQKMNARAIYLCRNIECLKNIKKCIMKDKFKSKENMKIDSLLKLIDELEIEVGE
ncbi:MAG: YlxR family protein [Clostridia bacterium]|nr:YlxR family protein [Clostridia bacterium]